MASSRYKTHTCELFEQATRLFTPAVDMDYDALVIGWPKYEDRAAEGLLRQVSQDELKRIPVIIFAESIDSEKINWVTSRPNTALFTWDEVSSVNQALATAIEKSAAADTNENHIFDANSQLEVMLVDDSPSIRHSYKKLLEKEGYNVRAAESVKQAKQIALRSNIDIAIVDYFMPEANGDVLIRHLKSDAWTKNIEIAVLTGTYSDEIVRECLDAGATECMFKNEDSELFLTRVRTIARNVSHKRSIDKDRSRLQHILESVGDGVFGVDGEGRIQFMNPAAKQILRHPDNDSMLGRLAIEKIHHSDCDHNLIPFEHNKLHNAYLFDLQFDGYETVFWTKDGFPIPVECSVNSISYDDRSSGAVVTFRDISRHRDREEQLIWQASHDPLTQMMNREAFEEVLIDEVSRLKVSKKSSALMFIDVDRFRFINDTAGQMAGDKILIEVSQRLTSQLGENDRIARVSGDEFAVILSDIDPNPDGLLEAANRFLEVIECQKFYVGSNGYSTSITAGMTMMDEYTSSISESMSQAGHACNIAKSRGRNRIHIYTAGDNQSEGYGDDLVWLTRLRDALVWNRFQIHYQPIVAVKDVPTCWDSHAPSNNWNEWTPRVPNRYEALVRLRDKDGKLIYPDAFLPLAERFELISKIDRWVIEHIFEEVAERDWPQLELFVNMSVITLLSEDLFQFISEMIMKTGINPKNIVFEITESSAVQNIQKANECIGKLRELGFRFALDDFGSGYSSFYHLKNLDVDIIKIDGIFTQEIDEETMEKSVMVSINEVSHSLGKTTVVEHVDRPEILKALLGSSVDYIQGYFVSEPLEKLPRPYRSTEYFADS